MQQADEGPEFPKKQVEKPEGETAIIPKTERTEIQWG